MIDAEAIKLSGYRLRKAEDLLRQSQVLLQQEMFDGSINRSYYCIFNCIRSILALVALDSSKHAGIIALFDRRFVKTGLFDKPFSRIVHTAFDVRQDSDYEDFFIPSQDAAQEQHDNAVLFLQEVKGKSDDFISGRITLPDSDV